MDKNTKGVLRVAAGAGVAAGAAAGGLYLITHKNGPAGVALNAAGLIVALATAFKDFDDDKVATTAVTPDAKPAEAKPAEAKPEPEVTIKDLKQLMLDSRSDVKAGFEKVHTTIAKTREELEGLVQEAREHADERIDGLVKRFGKGRGKRKSAGQTNPNLKGQHHKNQKTPKNKNP